jgi:hypothetical protein
LINFGSCADRSALWVQKKILSSTRPPAGRLNASGASVKPDPDLFAINDDRHFAGTIGKLQHARHLVAIVDDTDVFDLPSFFSVGITGRTGIGSCIFSENENAIRHGNPPFRSDRHVKFKIIK